MYGYVYVCLYVFPVIDNGSEAVIETFCRQLSRLSTPAVEAGRGVVQGGSQTIDLIAVKSGFCVCLASIIGQLIKIYAHA